MKIYITTSISYINAKPHLGHALEAIQADVLARYFRKKEGDQNVYFLTGTDEHGQKIYETAKKNNTTPQALADANAGFFRELYSLLDISNNDFIRTTEKRHKLASQKIWKACEHDIYKKKYAGWYCVGCETFITEKELVEGMCPYHKKIPEKIEEENYFFKVSKYSLIIKRAIESGSMRIIPETRKKEMLSLLASRGLEDISVSREQKRLPWGIPVPCDESQIMYVWFDALTNYISALDYASDDEKFRAWWTDQSTRVIHCIGKDILRHHAGIWPAMLLSAGIRCPETIFVHGFITNEGQKMSKSLGNVVDPLETVKRYGSEVLRYYLLHQIPSNEDGDFSFKKLEQSYIANLSNGLGNLLSRVTNMIEKYFDGKITRSSQKNPLFTDIKFQSHIENLELHQAIGLIWQKIDDSNKYIDDTKPWQLVKTDADKVMPILEKLLDELIGIADALAPFLPKTAQAINACLNKEKITKPEPLFPPIQLLQK